MNLDEYLANNKISEINRNMKQYNENINELRHSIQLLDNTNKYLNASIKRKEETIKFNSTAINNLKSDVQWQRKQIEKAKQDREHYIKLKNEAKQSLNIKNFIYCSMCRKIHKEKEHTEKIRPASKESIEAYKKSHWNKWTDESDDNIPIAELKRTYQRIAEPFGLKQVRVKLDRIKIGWEKNEIEKKNKGSLIKS